MMKRRSGGRGGGEEGEEEGEEKEEGKLEGVGRGGNFCEPHAFKLSSGL